MSYHPFDTPSSIEAVPENMDTCSPLAISQESFDANEPLSPLNEEPFHQPQTLQQQASSRSQSPSPDTIIRATSPLGRRYLKPVNGIQIKGFARSAQRRSSVVTLGSIERLQHFYARRDLVVNKVGTLGFKVTEEHEPEEGNNDDDDYLPMEQAAPPPQWKNLDVETDLDVLLQLCFQDIQQTLTTWAMVTGPRMSLSDHSMDSDTSDANHGGSAAAAATKASSSSFQILPLLQSVTKMLNSVKTYTMHRHDLSDYALTQLRYASLALLTDIKELERRCRLDEDEELEQHSNATSGRSTPCDDTKQQHQHLDQHLEDHHYQTHGGGGYIYRASDFQHLDKERLTIRHYLATVEKCALNPPHHRGGPRTSFTDEIKALMVQTGSGPPSPTEEDDDNDPFFGPTQSKSTSNSNMTSTWLQRGSFINDEIGRVHALLVDFCRETTPIPDPHEDQDAFWQFLADGHTLCQVYNSIVKQSRRPFGFINKIHEDTRRTYRAIENLRFFAAACKFRFDTVFDPFDPAMIARKTEDGLHMLEKAVMIFCQSVIQELRQSTEPQLNLCNLVDQALILDAK